MLYEQSLAKAQLDARTQLAWAINDAILTMHDRNRDELLAHLRRKVAKSPINYVAGDLDRIDREATQDIKRKLTNLSALLTAHLWAI